MASRKHVFQRTNIPSEQHNDSRLWHGVVLGEHRADDASRPNAMSASTGGAGVHVGLTQTGGTRNRREEWRRALTGRRRQAESADNA